MSEGKDKRSAVTDRELRAHILRKLKEALREIRAAKKKSAGG